MQELLKINEVIKITHLKRSTIYTYLKKNEFPKPLKMSLRVTRWKLSDIQEWLENRPYASSNNSKKGNKNA